MKGKNRFFVGRRGFSLGFAAVLFAPFQRLEGKELISNSKEKPLANEGSLDFSGTIYIVGGAADCTLRRFAELAGGKDARIVILPHPSSAAKETAEELCNSFMALGVKDCHYILPGEKKSLRDCSAVFISGGDQNRLMRLLEPEMLQDLRSFIKTGGLYGGTSAGAAAVSSSMIAGGMSDGLPKAGSLLIADGLGLLPGYMVDTHVTARARHDRLMAGLAMVPGIGGIGLDEDTAVEIKNGKATVRGAGLAHVYKRSLQFHSELSETQEGKMASVKNVLYSIYPASESFEL